MNSETEFETSKEICALIKAGFEYVCEIEGIKLSGKENRRRIYKSFLAYPSYGELSKFSAKIFAPL